LNKFRRKLIFHQTLREITKTEKPNKPKTPKKCYFIFILVALVAWWAAISIYEYRGIEALILSAAFAGFLTVVIAPIFGPEGSQ
jgi:hypothetical protein